MNTVRPTDFIMDPMTQKVLESSHMSATLTTESGSHYTVITRPGDHTDEPFTGLVVVINDKTHQIITGTHLQIWNGRMIVQKITKTVLETTPITGVYIMSN